MEQKTNSIKHRSCIAYVQYLQIALDIFFLLRSRAQSLEERLIETDHCYVSVCQLCLCAHAEVCVCGLHVDPIDGATCHCRHD